MKNFKEYEKEWQDYWQLNKVFEASNDTSKKKSYLLVEFPYPSGIGMHIGHIKAYAGLEVIARKRRMQGYNVLFPLGFDAFGLPTENSAIKQNVHPRTLTNRNIKKFLEQLEKTGFSFDLSRVVDTTEESYYKWTQWIFLKMFEKGLVFRNKASVNYCPSCKVVLSNEDSQGGKCDICHSDVIQKEKDVWYLRITAYADKLLEGLKEVDYPDNIKMQQENWIGKSTGAFVNFKFKEINEKLKIYTTRPDTMFGVTFMVMAPEHPLLEKYKDKITNYQDLENYKKECAKKTEFERTQLVKDKTGVKINGITIINPLNNKEIPIFVSDYVMMGYGTGAIMAVPAHDERDYDFAKKFNIDIIPVIESKDNIYPYTGDGKMINSDFLNGTSDKKTSINKMIEYLEKNNIGEKGVQYKMKDWAFNRQRYWGEPIPIVHCEHCGAVAIPYQELPLKLPKVENFEPGTDGESPLAKIPSFVNCTCPKCGKPAKRETDTMPQWAGSSWYFLRYIDPHNDNEFANRELLNYFMPVDWYNGGMEHVTRHVIYSRFWYHFLYDLGLVPTKEPYAKRTYQGLILGPDGEKMSKSKGNVIDPLDIVDKYGADVLRCYILFMGDYSMDTPWNDDSIKGVNRFIQKIINLQNKLNDSNDYTKAIEKEIHKTIKKVSEDYENMKYNTAISSIMILVNTMDKLETISRKDYRTLLILLNPVSPHVTEELNKMCKLGDPICQSIWPDYDDEKTIDEEREIAVQVNGKLRGTIRININDQEETIKEKALNNESVKKHIECKEIVKIIIIKGKIVNIVVK